MPTRISYLNGQRSVTVSESAADVAVQLNEALAANEEWVAFTDVSGSAEAFRANSVLEISQEA